MSSRKAGFTSCVLSIVLMIDNIWYLQEHFPVFPDNFERCGECGRLYDTDCEGLYWETKGKHYCGSCSYKVPQNYDRGKR